MSLEYLRTIKGFPLNMDSTSDYIFSLTFTGFLRCDKPKGYNLAIVRTNCTRVLANPTQTISIPRRNVYKENLSGSSILLAGTTNEFYISDEYPYLNLYNFSTDFCDVSVAWYEIAHR